jgi:predicted nucleotidyltransferase
MNLSEPLDGLTSEVEAAVLRVLARADVGFSGRQVHGLAGIGSTSSVHRALAGLVRLGLVSAEAQPPSIIYRMNREHALWPVVELALSARARVLESIGQYCVEEVPEEVPSESDLTVVVYGSVARRESTLDSDIDLFVVYPDAFDQDARADFNYRLSEHVERVSGNETQIFSVERSQLAQRISEGDPLVKNVLADGILVHGKPLTPASKKRAS